jgi:hypothetical protein
MPALNTIQSLRFCSTCVVRQFVCALKRWATYGALVATSAGTMFTLPARFLYTSITPFLPQISPHRSASSTHLRGLGRHLCRDGVDFPGAFLVQLNNTIPTWFRLVRKQPHRVHHIRCFRRHFGRNGVDRPLHPTRHVQCMGMKK